jgi:hypothetical protein
MAKKKILLGNCEEDWRREWQDMPEFVQEDRELYQTIIVRFTNKKDVDKFAKRIKRKITPKTTSIFYSKVDFKGRDIARKYVDES